MSDYCLLMTMLSEFSLLVLSETSENLCGDQAPHHFESHSLKGGALYESSRNIMDSDRSYKIFHPLLPPHGIVGLF